MLYPSHLEEVDGDFQFGKERRRDPFNGRSVRMRGRYQCNWLANDLHSINPELKATDRVVKKVQSLNYSASCAAVTAIDFCHKILESNIFSVERCWRYMGGSVLGKREAWDQVADALHEHAVSVQSDNYNKWRRTKDTLFEVPIIGHVISTDDLVQQSKNWPVLNGKACVPAELPLNVSLCAHINVTLSAAGMIPRAFM
jgi:hypothetical protein